MVYLGLPGETVEPVGPDQAPGAGFQELPETPMIARLPAPEPQTSVDTIEGTVRLPSGGYVPLLNGVKGYHSMKPRSEFLSPIDYKMVDQKGYEWYVLENGLAFTTVVQPGTLGDQAVERPILVFGKIMGRALGESKLLDPTKIKDKK